MKIAVVGGTGTVGRLVVEEARREGHSVVVVARSTGVDLSTGAGLTAALAGCESVIDVSNVDTLSRRKAVAFFDTAAAHLVRAGHDTGVRHLVVLSIVGVDEVDLGYYAGKRRQEEIALGGSVPTTVLRATQFHEFAAQSLARSLGPVVAVPRMRSQPVAAREVAVHLVALAQGQPLRRADDLAGPERHDMVDLVRRLAQARRQRRLVVPLRLPGATGRALAGGALLPHNDGPRGVLTFDDWLETTDALG